MPKIDFYIFKNNTDAIATNKGFYYQYLLTVKIWLDNFINNTENEIFCEREEDIFELNVKKGTYRFSQIKCYSDGFSLKSPEVASSLLNFYKLYQTYKGQYDGTFVFYTNSTFKKRTGSSLNNWQKKQINGDFSPTDFLQETREILIDTVDKKLAKYLNKTPDKQKIEEANKNYNTYVSNINSTDFINFLSLIRWEFSSISKTDEAISNLITDIKKIITSGKLKFDTTINEDFILAYLLNTVIEKSSENNPEDRLLNSSLLDVIINSTDLSKKIDEKLNAVVLTLMHNNFQIVDSITEIKQTTSKTQEIVVSIFNTLKKNDLESSLILDLTKQIKDWFNIIGYRFEQHETIEDECCGFIINITVRRGYDRIYILCISEPVEINHLIKLKELKEKNNCKEGWIITYKRISESVLKKVDKGDYKELFCYTFDELLDNDIDFSEYFNWLDNEISSKDISKKYIPLYCKKDLFDKNTNQKLDSSQYLIEDYVDKWLDDPSKKHISVLGEFGTGKTWFALHYAWTKLQEYKKSVQKGTNRPRIPIFIPLRDFSKSVNIESVFSEFFFKKHNSPIPNYDAFLELNKKGKLLLIFDGFDEMADRIDNQKMINNFWEIARTIDDNSKVILTCRNEHFPEAKHGRELLNAKLKASTQNLIVKSPEFEVLDLLKLNKKQIKNILNLYTNKKIVTKIMKNSHLLDLASRPIMIELIIDALKDIEEGKAIDISRVYLYAISKKLKKDIKEERTFTSLADKLYFMCELSWEMLSTDNMSIHYHLFPERIRNLFSETVIEQKDIDHWQYDMMGQSMLIRNNDGEYKPSHRSLLEFFTAYKFASELGLIDDDFKELASGKGNSLEIKSDHYKWDDYFKKSDTLKLDKFKCLDLEKLKSTFGKQILPRAILDLITNMISIKSNHTLDALNKIIEDCRFKSFEEVRYIVSNILLIITDNQPDYFVGKDLSHLIIKDFEIPQKKNAPNWIYHGSTPSADFSKTNFSYSDLTNGNFGYPHHEQYEYSNIKETNFKNANIEKFQFHFNQIDSISFLSSKNLITVGSPDQIRILNAENLYVIKRFDSSGWETAFSHDGRYLVHSGHGVLYIRNTNNFEIEIEHILSTQTNPQAQEKGQNLWTGNFAFSKNNQTLFVACNNSFVYEFNLKTQQEIKTYECFEGAETVSLSFDEKYLACSEFNAYSLWNLETQEKIKYEKIKKDELKKYISKFHPTNNTLVITDNSKMRFFNILKDKYENEIEIKNVADFCFSSDGKTIYTHNRYEIFFIDYEKKEIINTFHIEILNNNENEYFESIEKIVLDTNNHNLMLMTTKQIIIFNLHTQEVIDVYQNLLNMEKSNFSDVIGIDKITLLQLKRQGAIT